MAKAKSKAKKKRDDSFEAVAKRLDCGDDKDRFEAKLRKIAEAKQKIGSRFRTVGQLQNLIAWAFWLASARREFI